MIMKQLILRAFFIGEIICFSYLYCFGAQGIVSLIHMKKKYENNKQEITLLERDIKCLKQSLNRMQKNPFFIESMAREQLFMARDQEEVFFIE